MNELPESWAVARLADVAEVRLGRQRSPKTATGERMRPYLRAANVKWEMLLEQCLRFRPRVAALLDESAAALLQTALRRAGSDTEVWAGSEGVARIGEVHDADTVVAAG